MTTPVLFIGNKNYSSWSMRPWLALTWGGIAFEERVIPLGGPHYGKSVNPDILAVSPSGRVPALQLGELTVWDSLAICEWAAEQASGLWPADARIRAEARSVAAEMHAGFGGLRRDLSMNIRRRVSIPNFASDTAGDIERVQEVWGDLRSRFADRGDWLFGQRSIADAMFAPVCTRFRTYGVSLTPTTQAYCNTMFADADFKRWEADAIAEPWTIDVTDALYA
jgi:glutathione S-transferase